MRSRIFFLFLLILGLGRAALAQTQLIADGGFESPSFAPWVLSGGTIASGGGAFQGNQFLLMGGAPNVSESAYQTFTFPADLIGAMLSMEINVTSTNTVGEDLLNIQITDTNNSPILNLATAASSRPTGGYLLYTTNIVVYMNNGQVSSLSGRTLRLLFTANMSPEGQGTFFSIDNVSLIAGTTADVPPNDNFTNATVLSGDHITTTVNNSFASLENGEPLIAHSTGGHSVWWTWTSPGAGTVTMNTSGSAFTTLLAAYTGTALTNLTLVDDASGAGTVSGQSSFTFNTLKAGTLYQIALDGYNGQFGAAQFNLNFTPDKTPPVVAITSPKVGTALNSATVQVNGTASDNVGVTAVFYKLANAHGTSSFTNLATLTNGVGSGAYSYGVDDATWSILLTNLAVGPNTITVEAMDLNTNFSTLVSRVLDYEVGAPLGLATNGRGTITISGTASIARPTNGQVLNIGFPYELTAHPATGFGFVNWTGSITTNKPELKLTMEPGLSFTANFVEVAKPVLTVLEPKPSLQWSNDTLTVTGKATDLVGVSNVWFQFNGAAWSTDVNTSNQFATWSFVVPLTSGARTRSTNVLRLYAQNVAGNNSPTDTVTFFYIESDHPQVEINGSGSVSPNENNVLLELGRVITMTATPARNFVLSNWTDGSGTVLTNGPKLTFVMASNLVLIANFVPNPFATAAGTYQGLFLNASTVTEESSGFFSAQVDGDGSFTAKLQQGSVSYPFSGHFTLDGYWATNSLKSFDGSAMTLNLDLLAGDYALIGTLTNESWSATVMATPNDWNKTNPAPQAGQYTLVLPGSSVSGTPMGSGFGSVTVNSLGNLTFKGFLGDGTPGSQSTFLTRFGLAPFYIADGSSGMALGWLWFRSEPNSDIDAQIYWFKAASAKSATYPAGFTNTIEAVGSKYSLTKGDSILAITNGVATLSGAGLPENISDGFILHPNNTVTGSNKLVLTFTPSTGLFQGSVTNALGKTVPFNGAVLQKQNAGFGLFLDGTLSGGVSVEPTP